MTEYIAKCNEVVGISGKTLIVPDYIDTSKEIVRCRDCEHRYDNQCGRYPDWFDIELDGFCAWGGEKKGLDHDGYNYNKYRNIEHCNDQHGKCCN